MFSALRRKGQLWIFQGASAHAPEDLGKEMHGANEQSECEDAGNGVEELRRVVCEL